MKNGTGSGYQSTSWAVALASVGICLGTGAALVLIAVLG
jgi:hypothetical protein